MSFISTLAEDNGVADQGCMPALRAELSVILLVSDAIGATCGLFGRSILIAFPFESCQTSGDLGEGEMSSFGGVIHTEVLGIEVDEAPSASASSSSISKTRSIPVSLARTDGLKGAFLAAFDFRRTLSWEGEDDKRSSRLPTRAGYEDDSLFSSSRSWLRNSTSRTSRCLSSSMSPARLGCLSWRSCSALPLLANGRQAS